MPNSIKKNLQLYFTKIKQPSSPTPHLQEDLNHPLSNSSTPSSILIKNFNSLYNSTLDCTTSSTTTTTSTVSHSLNTMEFETSNTPDLSGVFASQRFFCSSPGRSNAIIDSSSSSSSLEITSSSSDNLVGGSIAIPTYSPDPYADFRRSMQEMVETSGLVDVKANWDYLHELLMCYLSLNPKSTHKFIVEAFADLLVSLLELNDHNK
ncbi:hypothetical protein LIER_28141 [Lithospermum erythrorhizon]|uniref:Transcription repressor n=1 Tax=Lithospermum erythrorhizon TaxID=34254 RepID=A0AAV3RFP7_LITER